jgi:hypothetical protein
LPGVRRVFIAVPGGETSVEQATELLGGRRVGSVSWRTRAGKTRVTSTFVAGEIAAPLAPLSTEADDGVLTVVGPGSGGR